MVIAMMMMMTMIIVVGGSMFRALDDYIEREERQLSQQRPG